MKILVTDEVSKKGLELLKEKAIPFDYKPNISHEELLEIINEYTVLVVRGRTKVTKDVIERGKNLKIIARVGVGLDNIDLEEAREKGITVINAAGATAYSVAELTIGLMIALARPIITGDETMRRGIWAKSYCVGMELYNKTLGVIGLGNIGSKVAKIAKAMGMRVIGYDVIKEKVLAANVELREFDDLLAESDIITLHVPLLPPTRGMIGYDEIKKMKKGVLIINTARMELINLEALIWGLEEGRIGGYAADSNLKPSNNLVKKLMGFPNVILTPHIGAQTVEAQEKAAVQIFEKIIELLRK